MSIANTLAQYLAGEFDNQEQAQAEPVWYVHLRLWQRPLPRPLFGRDRIGFFLEQANAFTPARPYRQRLLEICPPLMPDSPFQLQYYMLRNPAAFRGAGQNPTLLQELTEDDIQFLPGCLLQVSSEPIDARRYRFHAKPPPQAQCRFSDRGIVRQISLGLMAAPEQFWSYDKGIDPQTGRALWGAILGPYQFAKIDDFADQLPVQID